MLCCMHAWLLCMHVHVVRMHCWQLAGPRSIEQLRLHMSSVVSNRLKLRLCNPLVILKEGISCQAICTQWPRSAIEVVEQRLVWPQRDVAAHARLCAGSCNAWVPLLIIMLLMHEVWVAQWLGCCYVPLWRLLLRLWRLLLFRLLHLRNGRPRMCIALHQKAYSNDSGAAITAL